MAKGVPKSTFGIGLQDDYAIDPLGNAEHLGQTDGNPLWATSLEAISAARLLTSKVSRQTLWLRC